MELLNNINYIIEDEQNSIKKSRVFFRQDQQGWNLSICSRSEEGENSQPYPSAESFWSPKVWQTSPLKHFL